MVEELAPVGPVALSLESMRVFNLLLLVVNHHVTSVIECLMLTNRILLVDKCTGQLLDV